MSSAWNQEAWCACRVPTLAEAGWDVWERLAALEPADPSKGTNGAGQLEASLATMTAVTEQRNRLQVAPTARQLSFMTRRRRPLYRLQSALPNCEYPSGVGVLHIRAWKYTWYSPKLEQGRWCGLVKGCKPIWHSDIRSSCCWAVQAVSRRWVERAGQFVTDELIHLADGANTLSTVQSAARLQLPTHTAFHERAEALAPLLQVGHVF